MAMTVELPADVEAFVRAEVERGTAPNEADFLAKAVELYRELKGKHESLRARVQESVAQAERGEIAPLDTNATKAEARRRSVQGE